MKRLEIVIGPCWAEVKGYNARDLLVDVGSRPVYASRSRAWSTTPSYALDAVALAETRGYDVVVTSWEAA